MAEAFLGPFLRMSFRILGVGVVRSTGLGSLPEPMEGSKLSCSQ